MRTTSETPATIEALTVSIQVMRIGKKQMTMGVFRQLPVRKESSDSEEWGVVRYSCDDAYLWLVFTERGVMYRREIDVHRIKRRIREMMSENHDFHKKCRGLVGEAQYKWEKLEHWELVGPTWNTEWNGSRYHPAYDEKKDNAYRLAAAEAYNALKADQLEYINEFLKSLDAHEASDIANQKLELRNEERLASLNQLFIAV